MNRRSGVIALATSLALCSTLVVAPAAHANGYQNTGCAAYGAGSGNITGLSTPDYAYTQKNGNCGLYSTVSVQNRYRPYPGGPLLWTSSVFGLTFAKKNQSGTTGALHSLDGVFYFLT